MHALFWQRLLPRDGGGGTGRIHIPVTGIAFGFEMNRLETLISSLVIAGRGMLRHEINAAIEHSCGRLAKIAIPPVKYWLQVYVQGLDEEDARVQRTLDSAKDYPPRVKLLRALREDGTWPISKQRQIAEDSGPGPPYGWTYITMVRNLVLLHDYCVSLDEGYVNSALDKILSWQNEEGYIEGPSLDMIPSPFYNGTALSTLMKFGMSRNDSRVAKLIDWLMRMQRHDGGWNLPYVQDVKYLPQYRHMKMDEFIDLIHRGDIPYDPRAFRNIPSCYWSTVGALSGLAWIPDDPTDPRINDIARGGAFVLDGFFKKNNHSSFYKSEKHWTTLKYPTYFGSGYWALDSLLCLGFGPEDGRTEKPIRWLLQARAKDGFWYHKERPHKLQDQWLTVSILMVLRHYSDLF